MGTEDAELHRRRYGHLALGLFIAIAGHRGSDHVVDVRNVRRSFIHLVTVFRRVFKGRQCRFFYHHFIVGRVGHGQLDGQVIRRDVGFFLFGPFLHAIPSFTRGMGV